MRKTVEVQMDAGMEARPIVLPAGMYPNGAFVLRCIIPVTTSSNVPSPPLHTTRS